MNAIIAVFCSRVLGSMWTAYAFLAISLLPILWPTSQPVLQYLSSAVLQLVALPLLAVASDVRARDAEKRAAEQHDAVMDILRTVHETARLTAQAKSDVPDRRCAAQREDWMETVLAISRTNGGARSERTRPDALRPRR